MTLQEQVRVITLEKPGVWRGRGKKRALQPPTQIRLRVKDTPEYGVYFVCSQSVPDGDLEQWYLTRVYEPTCSCKAGETGFVNCPVDYCVHVRAARKRHMRVLFPQADAPTEASMTALVFGAGKSLPPAEASAPTTPEPERPPLTDAQLAALWGYDLEA